ncbi:hypothetical protein EVAR_96390_1 [Eumeta japonica]|uniref:Uncharacterized protein n=1 Tax=Eumeta variegata TaxID=151549 RepID=A0A4C1WCZ8_EUMVA|nr:hypothetical protein EVAR_96390_1 [Eumeta japonica]
MQLQAGARSRCGRPCAGAASRYYFTAGPTDYTPVSTRGQRRRLEGRWADRPRDNATAFYSLTSAVSIRRVHL